MTTTPAPTEITPTPEPESGNITTNSTTPAPQGGGGLSGGEIAGIVIGSVAGAIILGFAGYYYMQSTQVCLGCGIGLGFGFFLAKPDTLPYARHVLMFRVFNSSPKP
jgi:predicted lipid-binding transport protein (Tim44 family)